MALGSTISPLTGELIAELSGQASLCLSLYQPTHRRHPENRQDPIRFRNLVKAMGASLRERVDDAEARRLLAPFEALAQDADFWNHAQDGLAVLANPERCVVVRLPQTVDEFESVADSFHLKPLRRALQASDRYQVLAIGRDKVRLFEGNRNALDEVVLAPAVPRTITEALGDELTEPHLTVASYGGTGASTGAMHHGHGSKTDEVDIDTDRFFRAVDRAVIEHHSRPSGVPLLLAALPEHHHRFHATSQNPLLATEAIRINPDAISADALRALAWEAFAPRHAARMSAACERYEQSRASGLGSADLGQVAHAAASGRVACLLIEAERQIPGRLDGTTGEVRFAALDDPHVDDLLDDLGELVAARGGDVLVMPAEQMPTTTGLAATYRY